MAYNCTLYRNFSKRLNSTKQPTGGEVYACNIKHDTDFKNPVLEITAEDLTDVNYMQFNGDYFYVTSLIAHRNNVYEVAGVRDPMATYKSNIGSTSAMLLYSNNAFNAGAKENRVPDERLAISRVPQVAVERVALESGIIALRPQSGSFLLSAVGENGGVCSYVLTLSQMKSLLTGIGLDTYDRLEPWWDVQPTTAGMTVEDILLNIRTGLWKTMSNELAYGSYAQSIKACFWVPFIGFTGTVQTVYLGDYDTGVAGVVVGDAERVIADTFLVNIPWQVNDWRRNNCLVQLYLPLCGTVVLPVDKINNESSINVRVALDCISGTMSYQVTVGGVIYEVCGASASAPYAVGSSNITAQNLVAGGSQAVGGGISAVVGTVASVFTGGVGGTGSIAGGISSVAEGVMQAVTPQVQSVGSMGGISGAGLDTYLTCTVQYFAPIEPATFQNLYGHPVFCVRIPDAGYNCFRGFSVQCEGTPEEMTQINTFFNSGAFYE